MYGLTVPDSRHQGNFHGKWRRGPKKTSDVSFKVLPTSQHANLLIFDSHRAIFILTTFLLSLNYRESELQH